MAPTIDLDLDGFALRASGGPAILDWLAEWWLAAPAAPRAPDATVELVVDPEEIAAERELAMAASLGPGFTFQSPREPQPRWRRGDTAYLYDPELDACHAATGSSVRVVGSDPSSLRVAAMQLVRELHQRWLAGRGYRLLHAGAIAADGRVVLVAGPRETGKSTLITYLCAHAGASFLANDRVMARADGHVVGIPTIIGIRPGTLALVPSLPPLPWRRTRPHRHTLAELAREVVTEPTRDRLTLSARQLATWLGVPAIRAGQAVAVLFPEPTGDREERVLHRFSPLETRDQLTACAFPHQPDGFLGVDTPDQAELPEIPGWGVRLGNYPVAYAAELLARMRGSF